MRQRKLLKITSNVWRKNKGRSKVVAAIGVSPGSGVTHSVILMANYLRRQRLKVAVIELSGNRHYERIEKAYEGRGFDPITTDHFKIKQVYYHKNIHKNQLIQLYSANYDVIILDIGNEVSQYIEDFQMADLPVIISHTSDWKREEINAFMIRWHQLLVQQTRWLLPFATAKDVREFTRQQGQKGCALGFIRDPFVKDKLIDAQLQKLFS